jgi:predicted nucleic acid-binding protein
MAEGIANTSPLLYLHRIEAWHWLPELFAGVWIPGAVVRELEEGRRMGHGVPDPSGHDWLTVAEPRSTPSQWLSLDLGPGELGAMALALENPGRVLLLDDALARRTARAAGLTVWGTLRIVLEAKCHGLVESVAPCVAALRDAGMWMSEDIRRRILSLAGERAE